MGCVSQTLGEWEIVDVACCCKNPTNIWPLLRGSCLEFCKTPQLNVFLRPLETKPSMEFFVLSPSAWKKPSMEFFVLFPSASKEGEMGDPPRHLTHCVRDQEHLHNFPSLCDLILPLTFSEKWAVIHHPHFYDACPVLPSLYGSFFKNLQLQLLEVYLLCPLWVMSSVSACW